MLLRSLKLVVLRASVTYATRIQNVVRAHLANRKRLARLKQHHAAVVIQRTWRTQREMQKRWYVDKMLEPPSCWFSSLACVPEMSVTSDQERKRICQVCTQQESDSCEIGSVWGG
jgi:hypothetical protein